MSFGVFCNFFRKILVHLSFYLFLGNIDFTAGGSGFLLFHFLCYFMLHKNAIDFFMLVFYSTPLSLICWSLNPGTLLISLRSTNNLSRFSWTIMSLANSHGFSSSQRLPSFPFLTAEMPPPGDGCLLAPGCCRSPLSPDVSGNAPPVQPSIFLNSFSHINC